jgi:hypothetical protein
MTANEDDMPAQCIADPGSILPRIPGETVARWGVRALRAKGLLSTRASIGPDSALPDLDEIHRCLALSDDTEREDYLAKVCRTLLAERIGPDGEGPDDIVVSREDLRNALGYGDAPAIVIASRRSQEARERLAAALSQPHPAQEQQT